MICIKSEFHFRLIAAAFLCAMMIAAGYRSAQAQDSLRRTVYGDTSSSSSATKAPPRKKTEPPKKASTPKKAAPTASRKPSSSKPAAGRSSGTSASNRAQKPVRRLPNRAGMINVVFESKEPGTQIYLNGNPVGETGDTGIFERSMTPGTYRVSGMLNADTVFPEKLIQIRTDNTKVRLYEVAAAAPAETKPLVIPPTQAEIEMEAAREMSAKVVQVFADFLDPYKSDTITADDWRFVSEAAVLGGFQNLSTQQIEAQRSFAAGRVELAEKDPAKAHTSFQLAIRSFPSSPLPFIGLGDAYFASQQMEDALRSYEQAKLRGKHLSILHRRLGDTFRLLKKRKEAVASYSEAIKLGDSRYETKYLRARAMVEAEMALEAIPLLEELLKENPRAEVYYSLGEAYEMLKRDVGALDHYRKAVELDPNSAIAQYRLARIYYEQREYEKAVKGFDAALELDGDRNTFSHEDASIKRGNASLRIKRISN